MSYLSNHKIVAMLEEIRSMRPDESVFLMAVEQAKALLEEVHRTRLVAAEVEKRKLGQTMPIKAFDLYSLQMACWEGDDYSDTD